VGARLTKNGARVTRNGKRLTVQTGQASSCECCTPPVPGCAICSPNVHEVAVDILGATGTATPLNGSHIVPFTGQAGSRCAWELTYTSGGRTYNITVILDSGTMTLYAGDNISWPSGGVGVRIFEDQPEHEFCLAGATSFNGFFGETATVTAL
jgi:hypothetical protein